MMIYDVKINGLVNPVGYNFESLCCSWKVAEAKGKKQKDVEIRVSLDEAFTNIVYKKKGEELDSVSEPILFDLKPHTRYYIQICVWSDEGECAISEPHYFETTKMDENWIGKWIGTKSTDSFHPRFKKEFSISSNVKQARLFISGLGLFESYINDQKAGDDFLAPFISDYTENVQYCTYDITPLLEYGDNEIDVYLGNGWYKGRFGFGKPDTDKIFACIAEIRIEYQNGDCELIKTDETWVYCGSVFEATDIYDGERQNFLLYDGKDNPWQQVELVNINTQLSERRSMRLGTMEELHVCEVINTPAGETVLDFGQNFAGYIECRQPVKYGQTLKFEFGEILQQGDFYNENYRTAKSVFEYVSDGASRVIRPFFTFFGFRYVKVSGLDKIEPTCFVGKAVYSNMKQTGFIETANNKINRLIDNTLWGLKSNFLDIPTDCPQRDERLGWTGDAQVFARTAGYLMDTRAFYKKFLFDLRLDQIKNNGKMPMFFPNNVPGMTSSVWSDIASLLPEMFYEYYGNIAFLTENFKMMKDWVDSITREDQDRGSRYLWDFGFHFGDWLALDGATEQSFTGRTDIHFISSVYYYVSVRVTADTAKIIGATDDETVYRELSEKIKEAILAEYFTPNGRLAVDTQTAYLIALRFGVYRDRNKLITALKSRIRKDCYRIKGGFVGATMMNTVLADHGLHLLAYDFLLFEKFPGWLYAVNLGATTIWERWNSVLENGEISGTGMNSLNHYAYGSVVEFLFKHGAGIKAIEPGFRKVILEPKPDSRIGHINCKYDSASGQYVSNWKINDDGTISCHFEIPFGCSAIIKLPDSGRDSISVDPGKYDFTYKPTKKYLYPYDGDVRLELLVENKDALKVISKYLPQQMKIIEQGNIEELSKTLNDLKKHAEMFQQPVETFQEAISELRSVRL